MNSTTRVWVFWVCAHILYRLIAAQNQELYNIYVWVEITLFIYICWCLVVFHIHDIYERLNLLTQGLPEPSSLWGSTLVPEQPNIKVVTLPCNKLMVAVSGYHLAYAIKMKVSIWPWYEIATLLFNIMEILSYLCTPCNMNWLWLAESMVYNTVSYCRSWLFRHELPALPMERLKGYWHPWYPQKIAIPMRFHLMSFFFVSIHELIIYNNV